MLISVWCQPSGEAPIALVAATTPSAVAEVSGGMGWPHLVHGWRPFIGVVG